MRKYFMAIMMFFVLLTVTAECGNNYIFDITKSGREEGAAVVYSNMKEQVELLESLGISGLNEYEIIELQNSWNSIPEEVRDSLNMTAMILTDMGRGSYDYQSGIWKHTSNDVYSFDMEVFDVSKMYTNFLQGITYINNNEFEITQVNETTSQENVDQGSGKQLVSFCYNDNLYSFEDKGRILNMFRLEKVNERTFKKVIDMKLPVEQNKFVAPNVVSLAQAWLCYHEARPLAICNDDDDVVGFVMLDWDEDERTVGIWRFMIAPEFQNKGYGKKAMEAVIELVRNEGKFDLIHLDYLPGNTVAHDLYYSLGFRENGDEEDGEIIMTLPLTNHPKVGMLTADEEDIDDFLEIIDIEKNIGIDIPDELLHEAQLRDVVAKGCVKRFTIMGETIGFAVGDTLLIESKSQLYRDEVLKCLKVEA